MIVLTIDTATSIAAVGLVDDSGAVHVAPRIHDASAAQLILAAVRSVLAAAAISLGDVNRVVVGRGPGSFTGLRIGLATAQGLAAGLHIETIGVSSLAALLAGADLDAIAVIDARRGEVFAAAASIEPASCAPEQLALLLPANALLIGDGALRYRALWEEAGHRVPAAEDPRHAPAPRAMAHLAERQPGPVTALYLREPDAVPTVLR